MNILDTILYLVPDAKFSVWQCKKEEYNGENEPIEINGFLIDWHVTNSRPCPTKKEIEACDPEIVEQYTSNLRETQRKRLRDENAKKDLSLMQGYINYKTNNPDVSFSQYLDYLESLTKDI